MSSSAPLVRRNLQCVAPCGWLQDQEGPALSGSDLLRRHVVEVASPQQVAAGTHKPLSGSASLMMHDMKMASRSRWLQINADLRQALPP